MSCHTLPCWSVKAELSGERRKEVNVSSVMMHAGAEAGLGVGEGMRCGVEIEGERDDGVCGVTRMLLERGKMFVLVLDLEPSVGDKGTLSAPGTIEYFSNTIRSSSCVRLVWDRQTPDQHSIFPPQRKHN